MSVRKAVRPLRTGGDSAGAGSDKSAVGMERTIVHPEQRPGHRQSLRVNGAPDALPQVICRIACSRSRRPRIPAGQAPPGFKTVAALTGPVEAIVRPRNVASARMARLGFSQPPGTPLGRPHSCQRIGVWKIAWLRRWRRPSCWERTSPRKRFPASRVGRLPPLGSRQRPGASLRQLPGQRQLPRKRPRQPGLSLSLRLRRENASTGCGGSLPGSSSSASPWWSSRSWPPSLSSGSLLRVPPSCCRAAARSPTSTYP